MSKNWTCWYTGIDLIHPKDADEKLVNREAIILNELVVDYFDILDLFDRKAASRNQVKTSKLGKRLMERAPVIVKFNFKAKAMAHMNGRTKLEDDDIKKLEDLKLQSYSSYQVKAGHFQQRDKTAWWYSDEPKFVSLFQKERNCILSNFGLDITQLEELRLQKVQEPIQQEEIDDNIGNREESNKSRDFFKNLGNDYQ